MPFGYSNKIFKYPAVQYIPLDPFAVKKGSYENKFNNLHLYVFSAAENKNLHEKLKKINLERTDYTIAQGQVGIIIVNGYVELIRYRGYEVLLVGRIEQGKYHVFKITDKYFYKKRLVFSFYDGQSGERIALENYNIN